MRTNVVLPVWVPPPEVRPAAGLLLQNILSNILRKTYKTLEGTLQVAALLFYAQPP